MKEKLKFHQKTKEELEGFIEKREERRVFNFLNLYSVYLFRKNKLFRNSMIKARENSFTIPDGFTVALFLKSKRLQGPKFTRYFFGREIARNKRHFFLGSDSANEKDIRKIVREFGLDAKQVKYYNPPYVSGDSFSEDEIERIIEEVNINHPDFLWISLTNPKQEILAQQVYDRVSAKFIFNVGSSIDFLSQRKKESPEIVRRFGIEWLYRGITDFRHSRKKIWRSFIGLLYLPRTVVLVGR